MILIKKNITQEAKQAIKKVLKEHKEKAHFKHLGGRTSAEKETDEESNKAKIGRSLLLEQGFLCAYCMRRINNAEKIEHWTAQKDLKNNPNETLNYEILLAVCNGTTEINASTFSHCDTRRGELKGDDAELTINPTKAHLMQFVKYAKNGQMYFESDNQELNEKVKDDIIRRLALDIDTKKDDYLSEYVLRANRKQAYEAVEMLRKSYKARYKNDFSKRLENYIYHNWEEKDSEGKLKPYCAIVIHFKKHLMRPYY